MKFNIHANGFEHVTIVETAVGDQTGEATLYVNTGSFAESSLKADVGRGSHRATRVPIATLAKIVDDAALSRIDALKIDIEGYEDKALVPFFETAPPSLWPRRVLVEIIHAKDWSTDCVARMLQGGYVLEHESKSDALLVLREGQ